MRIETLWCVRDPSPTSTLADILWTETAITIAYVIAGTGAALWKSERTAIYTEEGEARADAVARLAARDAKRAAARRDKCWRCAAPLSSAQVDAGVDWCGCPARHVGDENEAQS